jgi:type II secretory pathway predicted ATPase ExeA
MCINEIKQIRLKSPKHVFTLMEDCKKRNKQKNLRIKRVPSSRINNASFDLLHQVLSTLESIKKGTIAAKIKQQLNSLKQAVTKRKKKV